MKNHIYIYIYIYIYTHTKKKQKKTTYFQVLQNACIGEI